MIQKSETTYGDEDGVVTVTITITGDMSKEDVILQVKQTLCGLDGYRKEDFIYE